MHLKKKLKSIRLDLNHQPLTDSLTLRLCVLLAMVDLRPAWMRQLLSTEPLVTDLASGLYRPETMDNFRLRDHG